MFGSEDSVTKLALLMTRVEQVTHWMIVVRIVLSGSEHLSFDVSWISQTCLQKKNFQIPNYLYLDFCMSLVSNTIATSPILVLTRSILTSSFHFYSHSQLGGVEVTLRDRNRTVLTLHSDEPNGFS